MYICYIDRPILKMCCTNRLFYFLYLSIRFDTNISATIPDNDRVERGFSLTMCISKRILEMEGGDKKVMKVMSL